ncbi:MAG: hypothetical protein BECKG1743D_GA0114223_102301 [Candidatus Kentron sp. G]|nr:MAG: hypothetical protein BECKG1743D_GA0114223_102301 [Candidatus Kentron sp. G]VFN00877.1 MAG: hypothetical protein BECKG1743F_GA0114225_105261 [Candidatus Kentron sp. G]
MWMTDRPADQRLFGGKQRLRGFLIPLGLIREVPFQVTEESTGRKEYDDPQQEQQCGTGLALSKHNGGRETAYVWQVLVLHILG